MGGGGCVVPPSRRSLFYYGLVFPLFSQILVNISKIVSPPTAAAARLSHRTHALLGGMDRRLCHTGDIDLNNIDEHK